MIKMRICICKMHFATAVMTFGDRMRTTICYTMSPVITRMKITIAKRKVRIGKDSMKWPQCILERLPQNVKYLL